MAITTSSHVEAESLVVEVTGVIRNADDEKLAVDVCYGEIMKYDLANVLIDFRKTDFRSSMIDQCEQVSFLIDKLPLEEIRRLRLAIIVDPKDEDISRFWEIYANNRGIPWKVFIAAENCIDTGVTCEIEQWLRRKCLQ